MTALASSRRNVRQRTDLTDRESFGEHGEHGERDEERCRLLRQYHRQRRRLDEQATRQHRVDRARRTAGDRQGDTNRLARSAGHEHDQDHAPERERRPCHQPRRRLLAQQVPCEQQDQQWFLGPQQQRHARRDAGETGEAELIGQSGVEHSEQGETTDLR
jgi:hypothetical protein